MVPPKTRGDEMKVACGVFLMVCASLAVAKSHDDYPKEQLAEFVVDKLDVTSIPSEFRPKLEKGKKTFADYGFATRKVSDNEALAEAAQGSSRVAISILQENNAGIFVCLNSQAQKGSNGPLQRVFLLKLKNSDGLLRGREASLEFQSCPAIGGVDNGSGAGPY
jgi:hypothetical protein